MKSFLLGIKAILQGHPASARQVRRLKSLRQRLRTLSYFWYDIRNTYAGMQWPQDGLDQRQLAAALLFQYHKLEKGMVMPAPHRMFGANAARATMGYLQQWHRVGYDLQDPLYLGALETLQSYRGHLVAHALDTEGQVTDEIARFLQEHRARTPNLVTPQPLPPPMDPATTYPVLQALARRRRSVRTYMPDAVPHDVLQRAVQIAQLSPSVCNRQTCQVHAISDPALQAAVLRHQNGNRGFGHLAPLVLMITAEESDFFDASERHQPYFDGGLFTMSFILALEAQGVSSCCLNWCVAPDHDRAVHALTGLPATTRILTMMVVGYAPAGCTVPRSPRRATDSVLRHVGPVSGATARAGSAER